MSKTALTFYVDDTNPYVAPPSAFREFVDFLAGEGLAGESSVILGSGWRDHGPLSRPATREQEAYLEQVRRAADLGVLDAHMEIMTHEGLFDFHRLAVPEGAQHEGVWLCEPEVSQQTYEDYLTHTIAEGERVGVTFTGLTWPGCSCETCTQRYAVLRAQPDFGINPNVWQALLSLAQQGRFRGRTVPGFFESTGECRLMAAGGGCAVCDLGPNCGDWFGIWENNPERVNADYYITADGSGGRIIELVRDGAPYVLFYAHWQGLNPARGVGWPAFVEVVGRVRKHLGDCVQWMRPSQYAETCCQETKG